MAHPSREKIAVIGGGIAGLTASYLLHDRYDITLFERTGRIGGNAYTYRTRDGYEVDIAVAAFGKAGYKNFYALLRKLKVATSMCPTAYMTMHNLNTHQGLYLTPLNLSGLWAQRFDLFRPEHIRAIVNVSRGLKRAMSLLREGRLDGLTVREAFAKIPEFQGETLLLVMCALCLMSSMFYTEVMDAPAEFFAEKLRVHNDVLSPRSVYSVRSVTKKTRAYVDALALHVMDRIRLNSRISLVIRDKTGVSLRMEDGRALSFDKVIFACPPDEALKLLDRPSREEKALLGAWSYKNGTVIVHKDHSSFPPKELIQAYTFLYTDTGGAIHTSVNGALWREPEVPPECDYISSQHPNFPITENLRELEIVLRTPIFDFRSCPTIARLPSLNGQNNTYFCGSYFGFGLHEDAVTSAISVARQLGVPWP